MGYVVKGERNDGTVVEIERTNDEARVKDLLARLSIRSLWVDVWAERLG